MIQRQFRAAPRWLTSAAEDLADCRALWQESPWVPVTLPTGRTFDAVVVGDRLGIGACDAYRRLGLGGVPTVVDHRSRKVAFLIAPGGPAFFAETLAMLRGDFRYRYLSAGAFLAVPGPQPEAGERLQWLRPPAPRPDLNAGAAVMLAGQLVASARRINQLSAVGHAR